MKEVIRKLSERGIPVWKYDLCNVCFRKPGEGRICTIFQATDGRFVATYPTDGNFISASVDDTVAFVERYLG